jgi:hypothetical protein
MKKSELKQLIKEVIQEMSSSRKSINFIYNVDIDTSKIGKNVGVQNDVGITVKAIGQYEDNRTDQGNAPSSGYMLDDIQIVTDDITYIMDQHGEQTPAVLFNRGVQIKEEWLTKESLELLYRTASEKLNN